MTLTFTHLPTHPSIHPPTIQNNEQVKIQQIKKRSLLILHLLGITRLDKEKNQCIRQKTGAQNIVKEIKLNSVALVRERTIPTERPPPVGEVSANFCG
jgi:hypothetical protein